MRNKLIEIPFILLILYGSICGAECFVTANAVGKDNNPVAQAQVLPYIPPFGWEALYEWFKADEKGNFSVKVSCKYTGTTLFITPALDFEKNFIPLHPPFSKVDQKYKGLAGIKLPYIKDGSFNLGTVIIPSYSKTEIEFVDESGNPFLPAVIDTNLWFRIRPVGGSWIKLGGTSIRDRENAKVNNNSVMKMTLPEGKWIIELNLNYGDGVWYYPDKIVDISDATSGTSRFRLKMTRKKTLK